MSSCADEQGYIFSYFKGNGEDGLHLAYSEDGYNWKALNNDNSFLTPELSKDKLMRDPCIILGGDGLYHMVWTISWTEKGIGYASSKDMLNWSEQKLIPVMEREDSVRNCWAPEITFDKANNEYMIYWSSTVTGRFNDTTQQSEDNYNHRIYFVTTRDFNTFSETKLLYDHGFNVIDASIVLIDGKFVMFIKDESLFPPQKNIRIAYSDELIGPYSEASAPITGNYWAEGPTTVKIGDEWIVYFDKYKENKFGVLKSKDLKNWEDVSDKISLPEGIRHGSIIPVPKGVVNKIKNSN
jgi:beta-xylosidase